MIKSIIFLLFIFFISSCDNMTEARMKNVIPVESSVGNYKIVNIAEYADEIEYIPLETNESSLISEIKQIIYEDGSILIADRANNCYLFDNTGRFIRNIGGLGNGLGEYLPVIQIFKCDSFVYVIDVAKMSIYDENGIFIDKYDFQPDRIPVKYTEHYMFRLSPLNENMFVMNTISMDGDYPKAIVFKIDQNKIKIINEYKNNIKLDKPKKTLSTDELGLIYNFKKNTRIYKIINDTIFSINSDSKIEGLYIFELGKYKPSISFLEGKEETNNIMDYFDIRNKYIFPIKIIESNNNLFIEFNFGKHTPELIKSINRQGVEYNITEVYSVFDKKTGVLTLMKQPIKGKLGFKNDIDNGPTIWPNYISSNDEMIAYLSPEEFMEYYTKIESPTAQMTEVATKIKEDDNPILMIVKIKK